MKTKTEKGLVTVLRYGNRIALDPTTPAVEVAVMPHLVFEEKVFLRGRELYEAKKHKRPIVDVQPWDLSFRDHRGRICAGLGFYPRIRRALKDAGFVVRMERLDTVPRPKAYVPQWDRVLDDPDTVLRYRQEEALRVFDAYDYGRIDCPPAFGKTFLIAKACEVFPKAKVVVTTDAVPVLHRIYHEMCLYLPDVGVFGGGMRRAGRRVTCATIDSLHHAPADADFVFVDECHQAGSDSAATKLARFTHARMFGLSATHEMRIDGRDYFVEQIFGPVRMSMTYPEAVANGLVAPVKVIWTDVECAVNPAAGLSDVAKKRAAYWTNTHRNQVIARDVRRYGDDVQTLITVETVEHALHLRKLLPEYTLVYSGESVTESDWNYYNDHGLVPDDLPEMDEERKVKLARRFEKGKLLKAIATPTWNVGVNFTRLAVLARADGGASPVSDVQIPGRTMRTRDGKEYAIVRDYKDQFDPGCERRALGRWKTYESYGFKQVGADPQAGSKLKKLKRWEDP